MVGFVLSCCCTRKLKDLKSKYTVGFPCFQPSQMITTRAFVCNGSTTWVIRNIV